MPIQSEVEIPQKITVLPDVIVTLTSPVDVTFAIDLAHTRIPGNGILTQTGARTCTVQGSANSAEWGEVTVKGTTPDGEDFGIAEIYFLIPFVISPAGEIE